MTSTWKADAWKYMSQALLPQPMAAMGLFRTFPNRSFVGFLRQEFLSVEFVCKFMANSPLFFLNVIWFELMYLNLFSSTTAQEYIENPYRFCNHHYCFNNEVYSVCLLHLPCNHTQLQVIVRSPLMPLHARRYYHFGCCLGPVLYI